MLDVSVPERRPRRSTTHVTPGGENGKKKVRTMSHTDHPNRGRASAEVPAALQRQIDENLKRLYGDALDEELPEALQSLVARLRAERGAGPR